MKKFKPIHTRLLFIDLKLREGKYPNCSSLSAEWEVNRKTIQRDLDYMRFELDAPIEYSKDHRGYYYSEAQFQLPAMDLKESDLFAIYLASKMLGQYQGTPVYDSLQSVFKKIEESLPNKISLYPSGGPSRFTVIPTPTTKIEPETWKTVFHSIRCSQTIEIQYQIPGAGFTTRHIDPYHGVRYAGDWYVIAFCHLRSEIRIFSMARIVAATALPSTFEIPATLNFDNLRSSYFGLYWGGSETDVKILFDKDVAGYIKEREWHPTQHIENRPDGSIIFSLKINHLHELKRWVLSWDSMAKILEPQGLVDEMKAITVNMVKRY